MNYLFYFSRQTNRKEKKKKNLDSRERALSAAIAENSIEVQGVKIPHFPANGISLAMFVTRHGFITGTYQFQQMKPCHVLRRQWILGLELSTTMCRISVHLDRRCWLLILTEQSNLPISFGGASDHLSMIIRLKLYNLNLFKVSVNCNFWK